MIVDEAFCAQVGIEYYDFDAEEQQFRFKAHMDYLDREREASVKAGRMLIGTMIFALCFWAGVGSFIYYSLVR